jgi:molybdopterin-guanine dinucleotide biosynthesis protein A
LRLTHVEGAVLVGGASSRMGRDKATLPYEGEALALRSARALSACVARVRLVARPGALPELGFACIEDRHPERAPLVGVHAALAACEASAVLVAACDLPDVDPRVLLALLALGLVAAGADVVAPLGPRGPEPLLAIYRPRLLPRSSGASRGASCAAVAAARRRRALQPEEDLRALDRS